jgi:hypothetical protein
MGLLTISLIILYSHFYGIRAGSGAIIPEDNLEPNNSQDKAVTLKAGMYYNLTQGDDDWYKVEIPKQAIVTVSIFFDLDEDLMKLEILNINGTRLNSSTDPNTEPQVCSSQFSDNSVSYIRITGSNNSAKYDLYIKIMTIGQPQGFFISDDYLERGITPNTIGIIVAYIGLAMAISFYLELAISFISRGRKSENKAQGTYYKGLGMFILSVAFSESAYLIDLLNRYIFDRRIFLESVGYPDPFQSFIDADYYLVAFTMILVGLAFLMYPMEKYLYANRTKTLTLTISVCIPFPLIIRAIEINHTALQLDLSSKDTFHYQMMMFAWGFIMLLGLLALLYLMKLYLDLGRKAPQGSQLRKKSGMIIWGLIIWLVAIFSTSAVMREISRVDSSFGPWVINAPGTFEYFIQTSGLYSLLPLLIPSLMILAVALLVSGFTRDY